MSFKKISIVTPSLNRGHLLEYAIQSVLRQNYPEYEHIIIDGGSTDNTADIVSKYDHHIRFLRGSDRGMYDALNKGLDLAEGEIIGFLNTDDIYADGVFSIVAQEFEKHPVSAVAGGATIFREKDSGEIEVVGTYSPRERSLLEDSTIRSNYFNAWFFHRSVFEKVGKFDIAYRVAGDRDFMLRLCLSGSEYAVVDQLIYQYRWHTGSLTFDDTGDKRELVAREHLWMTGLYLQRRLPRTARKLLVELQIREALEMADRSMKRQEYRQALGYFFESVKFDAVWLVRSLGRNVLRIAAWPVRMGRRAYKKWLVSG